MAELTFKTIKDAWQQDEDANLSHSVGGLMLIKHSHMNELINMHEASKDIIKSKNETIANLRETNGQLKARIDRLRAVKRAVIESSVVDENTTRVEIKDNPHGEVTYFEDIIEALRDPVEE
jgi:uncharacterized protein YktB (UPF0637 family)